MFNVPVSRKAVAAAVTAGLVTGVTAVLHSVGLVTPPADLAAWISTGEALAGAYAGAWVVGDGVKYANYLLARLHLSKDVTVTPGA